MDVSSGGVVVTIDSSCSADGECVRDTNDVVEMRVRGCRFARFGGGSNGCFS